MPYEIVNAKRTSSIIRAEGAGTYTVRLSDLSANTQQETVVSASIKALTWTTNTTITVARGATPNTVLTLHDNGDMSFDEMGYALANGATGNIVISVANSGTLIMEVTKIANYANGMEGL